MNKLAELIANGTITVEELVNATELIERAQLVTEGLKACKKTVMFPVGVTEIDCYDYMDSAGEYHAWGKCSNSGIFSCYCNWGGDHLIGTCNLFNFEDVFMAFENNEFYHNLNRFLKQQIEKTKGI